MNKKRILFSILSVVILFIAAFFLMYFLVAKPFNEKSDAILVSLDNSFTESFNSYKRVPMNLSDVIDTINSQEIKDHGVTLERDTSNGYILKAKYWLIGETKIERKYSLFPEQKVFIQTAEEVTDKSYTNVNIFKDGNITNIAKYVSVDINPNASLDDKSRADKRYLKNFQYITNKEVGYVEYFIDVYSYRGLSNKGIAGPHMENCSVRKYLIHTVDLETLKIKTLLTKENVDDCKKESSVNNIGQVQFISSDKLIYTIDNYPNDSWELHFWDNGVDTLLTRNKYNENAPDMERYPDILLISPDKSYFAVQYYSYDISDSTNGLKDLNKLYILDVKSLPEVKILKTIDNSLNNFAWLDYERAAFFEIYDNLSILNIATGQKTSLNLTKEGLSKVLFAQITDYWLDKNILYYRVHDETEDPKKYHKLFSLNLNTGENVYLQDGDFLTPFSMGLSKDRSEIVFCGYGNSYSEIANCKAYKENGADKKDVTSDYVTSNGITLDSNLINW